MPSRPETNPLGGIWPLGTLTIVSGTPQSILKIVGAQGSGAATAVDSGAVYPTWSGRGRPYSANCRQLVFTNTGAGEAYVNDGNFAGLDVNRTVAIIPIGSTTPQQVALPPFPVQDGVLDPSRYYLDAGSGGAVVTIYAVDASA